MIGPPWSVACKAYRRPVLALQAVKTFADQHVHRNPAVLRFAFIGFIVRYRIGFGHTGRGQHAIGFPAACLLQVIDDAARANFQKRCQLNSLAPEDRKAIDAWQDPVIDAAIKALVK